MEIINGFDIEKRELTEEEKTREITWERFKEFHYTAGEDFLDVTGEGNVLIFGGWLMHKYPELCPDILHILNSRNLGMSDFIEFDQFGYCEEKDIDKIYQDFAEFCNFTGALKERVNQVLIQVNEHYSS